MSSRNTRRRRTWPQRLLLLLGIALSLSLFGAARVFWEASTVLAELPRISVGPDVLAQGGEPGDAINVLLVGVDSSEGLDEDDPVRAGRNVEDEARGVVRPDTILVLRLDPATGSASVLSLPRDLIVQAPGGTTTRINATQAVGGIEALVTTIDTNFAIPINHFVVADFASFSEIVDLVGGVPINFPYDTRDLGSGLSLPAGCWALNGSESLAYVRARSIEELIDGEWVELAAVAPDLARIERQQEFLVLALEEVFSVARSDVSRLGDFVTAGAQVVQLDEALTPGDMLDLASAFADYDTEALEVSTIPNEASFSADGQYLGQAVVTDAAADVLAVFQGLADGVRPAEVEVSVATDDERHREELRERGFVVDTVNGLEDGPTEVRFAPSDRDAALLLTRYLENVPALVADEESALVLRVGPDFAGVRQFPRPLRDVEAGLDAEIRRYNQENAAPIPADNGGEGEEEGEESSVTSSSTTDVPNVPSTSGPELADGTNSPTTTLDPSSTLVQRGRPPDGAMCEQTGG